MAHKEPFTQRQITAAVKSIAVQEVLHHRLNDGSVDKPTFYSTVHARFAAEQPGMTEWWEDHSVPDLVQRLCNALARDLKANFSVGTLRGEYRAFVQVPGEHGEFILKHRMDVTVSEGRDLRRYHTGKERAHARERRYWTEAVTRCENYGLGDDDPIRLCPDVREEAAS